MSKIHRFNGPRTIDDLRLDFEDFDQELFNQTITKEWERKANRLLKKKWKEVRHLTKSDRHRRDNHPHIIRAS